MTDQEIKAYNQALEDVATMVKTTKNKHMWPETLRRFLQDLAQLKK